MVLMAGPPGGIAREVLERRARMVSKKQKFHIVWCKGGRIAPIYASRGMSTRMLNVVRSEIGGGEGVETGIL